MFIRIVKLTFQEEKVPTFLANFEQNKEAIRSQPGCKRLELLRDKDQPNIFFTYSWWEHTEDLENYRHSELFKNVWANTKVLFSDRPEAWSVDQVEVLS